jgi:SAM-dependent methyltransferase
MPSSAGPAVASPIAPDRNGSVSSASGCLPDLTAEQYEALRDDIRHRGVQVAVEICARTGEVLDGRVRVRICQELRIRTYARRVVAGLETEEARWQYRLRANCLRRQLDGATIKAMALAEMRRKPRSDRLLASLFGVSHTCVANWRREFISVGKLLPTAGAREGRDGKHYPARSPTSMYAMSASSASRASRLLDEIGDDGPGRTLTPLQAGRLAVRVRRERADTSTVRPTAKVKLYEGRFQEAGAKIESGSVDVIVTDPPYHRAWLDDGQWADLATLAARVLKPGGLLIAYAGIASLPEIMAALSAGGLTYHWTLATRLRTANRIYARSIVNLWKPLVLYSKGPTKLPVTVRDFCEPAHDPKSHHEWEQPEAEAEFYLAKLGRPGSVVLDPCAGSGTTLVVARRLGMTAVGIDSDPKAVAQIKLRMMPQGRG